MGNCDGHYGKERCQLSVWLCGGYLLKRAMRRNRNYAIQRKWNFHYLQAKSRKAFFYVVVHYTSKGLG